MNYAIASVDGVAVIVDADGRVSTIKSTITLGDDLGILSPKPVLPISIAGFAGRGNETCLIVDAVGNCWLGPVTKSAQSYEHIGKIPLQKQ